MFLATTNFYIVLTVLGGWVTLFRLFSYLIKEGYCLSEACEDAKLLEGGHAAECIQSFRFSPA
jgi:hypothetical protein